MAVWDPTRHRGSHIPLCHVAGCSVRTSSSVERILVEGGRATGVELRGGKTLRARKAVVSNADLHNTFKLVPRGASAAFDEEREKLLAPAAPVYSDDAYRRRDANRRPLPLRRRDASSARLPLRR